MIIIICMSKSPRKLEYREREREKKDVGLYGI